MNLTTSLSRGVLGVLLFALAGCAAAPPPPADSYYRLTLGAPAKAPAPRAASLVVRRLSATGLLRERPVVWADAGRPERLFQSRYDFWDDPPDRLIADRLAVYLRDAGLVARVVSAGLRAEVDYAVEGRLRRLEVLRDASGGAWAVLALELRLLDGRRGRLLLVRDYRREVPLADGQIDSAVVAWSGALAEVFADFRAALATQLEAR